MERERSISGRGELMLAYMGKKMTGGPLAPLETKTGLDEG
jgi:hypothetical protein